MKKHDIIWVSHQAEEKNLITTLVSLVKIIGNIRISQKDDF